MRTFDKKDIYSWFNCDDAKEYIGKKGYFADYMAGLQTELINNNFATLRYVFDSEIDDVDHVFSNGHSSYGLFIPADKVKKVEKTKKYRPFTLEEFNKVIPMGTVFKYKYKRNNVNDVYSVYYHANLDCENGFQSIFFEDSYHDFVYCFNEMKLFLNGKWQPFGVIDENA